MQNDSTQRFSDRAGHYARWRPSYPAEVVTILEQGLSLRGTQRIADIGSGTGICTRLLLARGDTVLAVEPNAAMREYAEHEFLTNPRFSSIAGTAENTTLPAGAVDGAVVAQAFHWFDRPAFRRELLRILRPNGWCALIWNTRKSESSAFMREYEALIRRFGTDYGSVSHENLTPDVFSELFGGEYTRRTVPNPVSLPLEGVQGRLHSTSYVPRPGEAEYAPMMAALTRLFDDHGNDGKVRFEYETEVYYGRPH